MEDDDKQCRDATDERDCGSAKTCDAVTYARCDPALGLTISDVNGSLPVLGH